MAGAELDTSTKLDDLIVIAARRGFRRSLSLFDFDFEELEGKKKKSEYEEDLEKETREWQEFLKSTRSRFAELRNQQEGTIDETILSKEQSAYIDSSPDFSKVIEESNSFCETALDFLAVTENIGDRLLALEQTSKWVLDHESFDAMYHCLYSNKEVASK